MGSIFCCNLEFDARQADVERLFGRYGRVNRVDMKSGFAFIHMEDVHGAEDAIRKLDRIQFGRRGRQLRVEWMRGEHGDRRHDISRRYSASSKPSRTLFVIKFDPIITRIRDIEKHFEPYGKILNVKIRRNFSFVQFESQEDATRALEATHRSKFMDQVIEVDYAMRDDDDQRNGCNPDRRDQDRSPNGRSYDHRGSPSGSPDYGHGSLPKSGSERNRSPAHEISRSEPTESHGNGREASPVEKRHRSRSPSDRERSLP